MPSKPSNAKRPGCGCAVCFLALFAVGGYVLHEYEDQAGNGADTLSALATRAQNWWEWAKTKMAPAPDDDPTLTENPEPAPDDPATAAQSGDEAYARARQLLQKSAGAGAEEQARARAQVIEELEVARRHYQTAYAAAPDETLRAKIDAIEKAITELRRSAPPSAP